jgi:hypothetical protein
MWTTYLNESQNLLNRNARGFVIALILFLYLIVFSPLWFTGFMIQQRLFPKFKGVEQVLTIVGISLLLYWILFLLKGIILFSKGKGNLIWFPLYLVCTGFATIAPAIVGFKSVGGWTHPVGAICVFLILFAFTYGHYQFHADGAPWIGRPAYHLGIVTASKMM